MTEEERDDNEEESLFEEEINEHTDNDKPGIFKAIINSLCIDPINCVAKNKCVLDKNLEKEGQKKKKKKIELQRLIVMRHRLQLRNKRHEKSVGDILLQENVEFGKQRSNFPDAEMINNGAGLEIDSFAKGVEKIFTIKPHDWQVMIGNAILRFW